MKIGHKCVCVFFKKKCMESCVSVKEVEYHEYVIYNFQ